MEGAGDKASRAGIEAQLSDHMGGAGIGARDYPGVAELRHLAGRKWNGAVDQFPELAPDKLSRRLLIEVWWHGMEPADYLLLIERMIPYVEKGIIEKDLLDAILFPRGPLDDLLAYNYKLPKVRAIVSRARPLRREDRNIQGLLDDILSGRQLRYVKSYRKAHRNTSDFPYKPPVVVAQLPQRPAEKSQRGAQGAPPDFGRGKNGSSFDQTIENPSSKRGAVIAATVATALAVGLLAWLCARHRRS